MFQVAPSCDLLLNRGLLSKPMVITRLEDPPNLLVDLVNLDSHTLRRFHGLCHLDDHFFRNSQGSLSLKHGAAFQSPPNIVFLNGAIAWCAPQNVSLGRQDAIVEHLMLSSRGCNSLKNKWLSQFNWFRIGNPIGDCAA